MPKKSILIVDDDPRILTLLEDALAHPDLTLTKASDALKGFIMARDVPPLLIICDIQLPGYGDGMKMLKLLREDPRVPRVPFLFITGMEQKKALAMLPPGDPSIRLMSKPLNLTKLRDYVWKLTGVA